MNTLLFHCVLLVFSLVQFSNSQFQTKVARVNERDNSIVEYEYFEVESSKRKKEPIRIPVKVYAEINKLNKHRTSFSTTYDEQMTMLKAVKKNASHSHDQGLSSVIKHFESMKINNKILKIQDERGHLVGSQFYGPIKDYNMVPMISIQNRNERVNDALMPTFYDMEAKIKDHLLFECGPIIAYSVTVNYPGIKCNKVYCEENCDNENKSNSGSANSNTIDKCTRPKSFKVEVDFIFKDLSNNNKLVYDPSKSELHHINNDNFMIDLNGLEKKTKNQDTKRKNTDTTSGNEQSKKKTKLNSNKNEKGSSNPPTLINGRYNDIKVRFFKNYDLSFGRYECINLDENYTFSSNLTVLYGQCVEVFNEIDCFPGSGNKKILQGTKPSSNVLDNVKSITGCCSRFVDQSSPSKLPFVSKRK